MHGNFSPGIFSASMAIALAACLTIAPPLNTSPPNVPLEEALSSQTDEPSGPVRIGIYDNRLIAVAWFRSGHNALGDHIESLRKARAEGDSDRVKELQHWGEMHQRKLHFQGFGTYPVSEYIEAIGDKIPDLLHQHQLDALVWMVHDHEDGVETVDVSVEIMVLFGIDRSEAEKMHAEMRKHAPLDFATLFDMDPQH